MTKTFYLEHCMCNPWDLKVLLLNEKTITSIIYMNCKANNLLDYNYEITFKFPFYKYFKLKHLLNLSQNKFVKEK